MGQILLHIGAPKCGSTYLQRVLLKNRRTLSAHGFAYPHSGQGHPGNGLMIGDITFSELEVIAAGSDDTDLLIRREGDTDLRIRLLDISPADLPVSSIVTMTP